MVVWKIVPDVVPLVRLVGPTPPVGGGVVIVRVGSGHADHATCAYVQIVRQ